MPSSRKASYSSLLTTNRRELHRRAGRPASRYQTLCFVRLISTRAGPIPQHPGRTYRQRGLQAAAYHNEARALHLVERGPCSLRSKAARYLRAEPTFEASFYNDLGRDPRGAPKPFERALEVGGDNIERCPGPGSVWAAVMRISDQIKDALQALDRAPGGRRPPREPESSSCREFHHLRGNLLLPTRQNRGLRPCSTILALHYRAAKPASA